VKHKANKIARLLVIILLSSPVFGQKAVVVTTDFFSAGGLSVYDPQTTTATNDVILIHSDAVVRTHGDRVYVLNRLNQDNIIVLSKDDLTTPIIQYSTGDGSNPHDIEIVSEDKAYVTLYERDYILVLNPATGDSLGAIDISAYADADGIPETSQLTSYQGKLYAVAQRLDRNGSFFPPTDFSTVIVIDTNTDTLIDTDTVTEGVQGIRLETKNPSGDTRRGGKWVLSTVGSFGANDGGIEVVDLATTSTDGVALTEAQLGGDVGALAMVSDAKGYVVISDPSFANNVIPFDLSSQTTETMLSDHSGGFTPSVGVLGNTLYVLDRGQFDDPSQAGLRLYDTSTNTLTSGPIATGLPPSGVVFIDVKPADYDGNGEVAFEDFLLFAAAFGKSQGEAGYGSQFDLSGDGTVDFQDFLFFAEVFGQ